MATESARVDRPKLEFACSCGKKYRVKASKAGARMRCKRCRIKLRVPSDPNVSMRSRAVILEELGIDPATAASAYASERKRSKKRDADRSRSYRCTRCESKIAHDDLKPSYCADGLVCQLCRAERAKAEAPAPRAAVELTAPTPAVEAAHSALLHLGLFLAGFAGPAHAFAGLGWGAALGVALPFALGGAALVYRARYTTFSTAPPARRQRVEPAAEQQAAS